MYVEIGSEQFNRNALGNILLIKTCQDTVLDKVGMANSISYQPKVVFKKIKILLYSLHFE